MGNQETCTTRKYNLVRLVLSYFVAKHGCDGCVFRLKVVDRPKPTAKANEVVVKIHAAALNHRDLFQRQHLYPRISFEHPILADGTGVVVEVGSPELKEKWLG